MSASANPIVLAFSGGLDTSFCIPWLKETYERPVVTVTVNTGGLDDAAKAKLEERSRALGAIRHHLIERALRVLRRRPQVSDHGQRAARTASTRYASAPSGPCKRNTSRGSPRELGANTVAHGCTAAGNDQVRFEIVLATLAPQLEILAPVRDHAWAREHASEIPGGARPTRAGQGRRLLDQPRPMGSDDRRHGDARFAGSIPESAWVLSGGALDEPARSASSRSHSTVACPSRSTAKSCRRCADREARADRAAVRRSGAASISATRSSAQRAALHSRRRRPTFC